jgi:hypothetical protein
MNGADKANAELRHKELLAATKTVTQVPLLSCMQLRDFFAAAALMGMVRDDDGRETWTPGRYAVKSYEIADAMIKAREDR